jgi:tetratricopeptide (TPR) repeat protein
MFYYLKKLVGSWPRTPDHFVERAELHAEEGNLLKAIDDLTTAIRLRDRTAAASEEAAEPYEHRGHLHMALGNFERAIEDWEEGARVGQRDESVPVEIANCHLELGNIERAEVLLKQALAAAEAESYAECEARLGLARVMAARGNIDEARQGFDRVIDFQEQAWDEAEEDAYRYRGEFLFEQKELQAAIADFEKCLEAYGYGDDFDPATPAWLVETIALRGRAQREFGQYELGDKDERRADELQEALRNYRPKSDAQLATLRRIEGALGCCGKTFVYSLFLLAVQHIFLPPVTWLRYVVLAALLLSLSGLIAALVIRRNVAAAHRLESFKGFES